MSTALRKLDHLEQVKILLLSHPEGININAIHEAVGGHYSSIHRYVNDDLKARKITQGVYTLDPTEADIELAHVVLRRIDEPRK